MEITSIALIKLACILSAQPNQEAVRDFLSSLSQEQVVEIQAIQKSGVCLPPKFNGTGTLNPMGKSMPTEDF